MLIPYLAGIILADRFDLSLIYLWILSAILLISVFIAYKKRWLSLSSTLLVIFLLFIGFLRYEMDMIPPSGLDRILYKQVTLRGTVTDSQTEQSGGSSLIVKGEAIATTDPPVTFEGKVFIRSWDDIFSQKYGDIVEVKGKLTRPRAARNPGLFDYRKYLMRRGIFATMTVENISEVENVGIGGNPFLRWVQGLRGRMEAIADDTTPTVESAAILKGVTLGERSGIEKYQDFIRTSTAHILVVSGMNVAIIAGCVFMLYNWVGRWSGLERRSIAYIPAIPVIIVYALMVGLQPSVIRASILAILFIISVLLDRERDLFNILAIAALTILIFSPGAFWDVSFQLSFGTVASITYLMPYWQNWLAGFKRDKWYRRGLYRSLQIVAISISAQIGSSLIIAHTFNRFSLVGPVVNPIINPLVDLITPIGFAQCLIGLAFVPLASVLGYINYILISALDFIVHYFARFPYLPVSGFSLMHIMIFSAVVIFAINLPELLKERRKLIVVNSALLTLCVWAMAMSYGGHVLKVTYLDVGQGDSIFAALPNGEKVLIDGGSYILRNNRVSDTGKRVVVPFLQSEGVGRLNLVVSTHPHNDHAGGLTYLVDNLRVDGMITGSYGLTTPTYKELRKRLDDKGIKYSDASISSIFKDEDLDLEVLGPQHPDLSGTKDSRMNNNSVVFKITYKGVSFLFPGDIEWEYEQKLINSGKDIKSTVLKVPHHGFKSSSSWEFLRAVQPTVGVISVGYPYRPSLGKYNWLGIKTYRTDRQGAITVITDGRRGWIKTRL